MRTKKLKCFNFLKKYLLSIYTMSLGRSFVSYPENKIRAAFSPGQLRGGPGMRNLISPYYPSETKPSLNRLHTIIDIDKGRIPDNPRLQGGRVPEDVYVQHPFFFGGANIRSYARVR